MSATTRDEITRHYTRGNLWERLEAGLADDGVDPAQADLDALAPYDHLHGRGLEATAECADHVRVARGDRLLDIGSGIGGPARCFAQRFGCHVTGIDLTAQFCEVARHLSRRLGFEVLSLASTAAQARAYGARSRAAVERGGKPLHRAVMLIHGDISAQAMANSARAALEGRVEPIEVLARKPG